MSGLVLVGGPPPLLPHPSSTSTSWTSFHSVDHFFFMVLSSTRGTKRQTDSDYVSNPRSVQTRRTTSTSMRPRWHSQPRSHTNSQSISSISQRWAPSSSWATPLSQDPQSFRMFEWFQPHRTSYAKSIILDSIQNSIDFNGFQDFKIATFPMDSIMYAGL